MNRIYKPEPCPEVLYHDDVPTAPPVRSVPQYGIPPRLMPKRIRFREKFAAGKRVFYGMALLWTAITALSMMLMLLA